MRRILLAVLLVVAAFAGARPLAAQVVHGTVVLADRVTRVRGAIVVATAEGSSATARAER